MSSNFPIYGVEYVFYVSLESRATPGTFQTNPTLESGDATVSKDGASEANLDSTPAVTPAGGVRVKVTVSAVEMEADDVSIVFRDAAGSEWFDYEHEIQPQRIPFSTVDDAVVTPTTTVFGTDLTETTDNHYNDLFVYFLTGANAGVSRKVSSYANTNKQITVATALPDAPADGDKFLILGRSE